MRTQVSKPLAVLISDVHYSLSTLELADKAFRMAIDKAHDLKVRLYDLGDITNDKANLRAEVVNRLIETMTYAEDKGVSVTLLVGNHSLINEKSKENALEFLSRYATLVRSDALLHEFLLLPYKANPSEFTADVSNIPAKAVVLAHQGLKGALPGHYSFDHSAVSKQALPDGLNVFSGHYHNGQTLPLPGGGSWTYVGNPYTLTFGEAGDTPKGFLVLFEDGTFERIPCNLRKHVVVERTVETSRNPIPGLNSDDLLWLKVTGNAVELANVDKEELGKLHLGHTNYRFEKILDCQPTVVNSDVKQTSSHDIMIQLIDSTTESDYDKKEMKQTLRELLS